MRVGLGYSHKWKHRRPVHLHFGRHRQKSGSIPVAMSGPVLATCPNSLHG